KITTTCRRSTRTSSSRTKTSRASRRPERMRILGIDPGSVRTGWGVVEITRTGVRGIAAGAIVARESEPLPQRLHSLYEGLSAVLGEQAPKECAIEDSFYAKNAQAALKLGHARGVAMLAAAGSGLEVCAYPPAVVKRAVGGSGRAEKTQVARMVGAIL